MLDTLLRVPPFNVRVRSPFKDVARHIQLFYGDAQLSRENAFIDFDISIVPGRAIRRWWRAQARFELDGLEPFQPLPANQAAPLFEWSLNWSIASRALGYLVMHAGVVARDDQALLMPGFPGAGKSTLCAALVHLQGWRLLSDELAILNPRTGLLSPNPRPISVKNASIDIVSSFPGSRLGPSYADTRKGTISHAAVPCASRGEAGAQARCRWVVFPQFAKTATAYVDEITRAEAFALISEQSFNKERMGEAGFMALCAMLNGARCFQIGYDSTETGLTLINQIIRG